MITWIYGNSGAGKSTLAERLRIGDLEQYKFDACVILDGDALRTIWSDLGLSEADRREQNLRAARLAKLLDDQGVNVIVATICPYRDLREQVRAITDCRFIYLEGGKVGPEYPFEQPGELTVELRLCAPEVWAAMERADERAEAEAQTAAYLHDERAFG